MIKIGITGSLSSGKTTASKILSLRKGPLFSADIVVKKLYRNHKFIRILSRKLNIPCHLNIKENVREGILKNKFSLKKIEKIIQPFVRKEMRKFIKDNRNKKLIFLEIPLLIESKLMNIFDVIIYIKAKRNIRLKRFISKGGRKNLFRILDQKQLPDRVKSKLSDHVIFNEKNINILKNKLLDILKIYE